MSKEEAINIKNNSDLKEKSRFFVTHEKTFLAIYNGWIIIIIKEIKKDCKKKHETVITKVITTKQNNILKITKTRTKCKHEINI